jgi:hypothetical protein
LRRRRPELPAGWQLIKQLSHRYEAIHPARQLQVRGSNMIWTDGRRWALIRITKPKRVPSFEDICYAKNIFIGPELEAYEVHAPKSRHVNREPNTIDLWCPLDGPVLPDFSHIVS